MDKVRSGEWCGVCFLFNEKANTDLYIFFFDDTATTEFYTSLFVGSVRCVYGTEAAAIRAIGRHSHRPNLRVRRDADPYTHLRAHETKANPVCRLLPEKKKAKLVFRLLLDKKNK